MAIRTVGPSGADYTSLAAAEAGEQRDLVAFGDIMEFEVQAFNDTTSVTFDGWTTSATRYIRVYPAAGAEAQMPWSTSAYRLTQGAVYQRTLRTVEDYVRIERIQIENNNSSGWYGVENSGVQLRLDGCMIRSSATGTTLAGVGQETAGASTWIRNCVVHGWPGKGISAFRGEVRVWNCTVTANRGQGVWRDSVQNTLIVKNTLSTGNTLAAFAGGLSAGSEYNASNDGTATSPNSRINQTFTFVDATGGDYHLTAGDTGAKDFGTDLSADASWPFSTDFDGQTRATPWDIGADEVVGTGGTIVTPGVGALVATGYAPAIATPRVVLPALGELTATGYAPAISTPRVVLPDVGVLTATGYAPTVAAGTGAATNVTPGVGALSAEGYAPAILTPRTVTPDVGVLVVDGYAPLVEVSSGANVDNGVRHRRLRMRALRLAAIAHEQAALDRRYVAARARAEAIAEQSARAAAEAKAAKAQAKAQAALDRRQAALEVSDPPLPVALPLRAPLRPRRATVAGGDQAKAARAAGIAALDRQADDLAARTALVEEAAAQAARAEWLRADEEESEWMVGVLALVVMADIT